MKPDDILIVGDSFAKHRDKATDWPVYLVKLLTGQDVIPRGAGFGGASWWSTRKCILAELERKIPQLLVICHTEAMRLPSDYDFGINVSSATRDDFEIVIPDGHSEFYTKEIKTAASMFYTYLLSTDYANWAFNSWCQELDTILQKHKIQTVHLYCFPPAYTDYRYVFRNGVTVTDPLWEYSRHVDQTTARNHFTPEQNLALARFINNLINVTDHTVIDSIGELK